MSGLGNRRCVTMAEVTEALGATVNRGGVLVGRILRLTLFQSARSPQEGRVRSRKGGRRPATEGPQAGSQAPWWWKVFGG